jgi:hypothetical protein
MRGEEISEREKIGKLENSEHTFGHKSEPFLST